MRCAFYYIRYMLPGKVFLQGIKFDPDRSGSNRSTYKLNLILNDIYYDELKQYHSKYLCVTAEDTLTLELYATEANQLLGVTTITDVYKHMLDNRTIDVKVKPKEVNDPEIVLKVNFQTVSAYRRKSPVKSKAEDTRRAAEQSFVKSPAREKEKEPASQAELSFSYHRQPFNQTLGNTSRSSMQGTAKLQFEDQLPKQGPQGESLQSLAQQREKILGQLFGKFKRER